MNRVYLDQNKWVDLASAEKGLAKGKRFEDALLLLRAMVDQGDVSLPLSATHYMETHNRRRYESRRELASTMAALSRLHTIAPSSSLLPGEFDRAFNAMCGKPVTPCELKPFGVGVSHAFGFDIPVEPTVRELASNMPFPAHAQANLERMAEFLLLAGLPPNEEAQIPDYEPMAHLEVSKRTAREKESLRALRQAEGWHKGEKAKRVAKAQAMTEHIEPLNDALGRAEIGADDFMVLEKRE